MDAKTIIEAAKQQETEESALRSRMDADYDRIQMQNVMRDKSLADAHIYTSNGPHVFLHKVVTAIATAKVLVQSQEVTATGEKARALGNAKERMARLGFLRNDTRLRRIRQPNLLSQYAFYASWTGWVAGCSMLQKRPDMGHIGSFYGQPFNPRHTYGQWDENGLRWTAHRILKTQQEVRDGYGYQGFGTASDKRDVVLWDAYDRYENGVFLDDGTTPVKAPQSHGAPGCPCFIIPVGPSPLLQVATSQQAAIADFGEGVLHGVRSLIDEINFVMSVLSNLTARSLKRGWKHYTADGHTLEHTPNKDGAVVDLIKGEEDLLPLELLESAKELLPYLQQLIAEWQRATMAFVSYGSTPFQLSAIGMNTLNREARDILEFPIMAVQAALLETANMWIDSLMAGAFDPSDGIEMRELESSPPLSIRLVPELPEDLPPKWQMFSMATSGPMPRAADRWAAEHILEVDDADAFVAERDAQVFSHMTPEGTARAAMKASAKSGDMIAAASHWARLYQMITTNPALAGYGQLYLEEARELGIPDPDPTAVQQAMQMKMLAEGGQPGEEGPNMVDGKPGVADLSNGGQGRPAPGGMPANIAPAEAVGTFKPAGPPQQGPNVPPNTPRPGAQGQPNGRRPGGM